MNEVKALAHVIPILYGVPPITFSPSLPQRTAVPRRVIFECLLHQHNLVGWLSVGCGFLQAYPRLISLSRASEQSTLSRPGLRRVVATAHT